jgi:competence protein ComEA
MREQDKLDPNTAAARRNEGAKASGRKIDLNTASAAELEDVLQIGPERARRIVEFRERNGPFEDVHELDDVEGFDVALIERVRPRVTLHDARTSAPTQPG